MSTQSSGGSPRQQALTASLKRVKTNRTEQQVPISQYFGSLTFDLAKMREKLPKESYQNLIKTLEQGKKLNRDSADAIATAIKEWAVSQKATHFCHWFQPMTGLTAEKHDSFITIQYSNHSELKVIENFSGSQLIQGEPDASSFPSGGMRSTFEARGYTAWDPSSPIFIVEEENTKTLCIPTVFFGYHGQALDNKTPLLRSVESLSTNACEFLKLIGDLDVKRISATLGCEQEYFLVDKNFVALRPDIIMSGRSLLGAASSRGQQLEDHYFGSIPGRVKAYMEDVETELYKLGIPVKTRHNEVAPSQFELAPIFEDANIASDHNTISMEVLKRVALRHGLVCLLHEKPFAGINGSGKHNNWSMSNDKGENLLDPGTTPHQNLRFLAVLSIILKAVHTHAAALRASIATPGNDHRLGANEAPPAIISAFLGQTLSKILNDIEAGKVEEATPAAIIDLGVARLPEVAKDNTDRNRTSPFAFTGNKFEFRAVGSSANVSVPVSFLNAAVAQEFQKASARLKTLLQQKETRDEAVMELVRQLVVESKTVRFDGNGYSQEWRDEAKRRGLPILNNTAQALPVLKDEKITSFLVEQKVLTREEIASRFHIMVERYNKTLEIEAFSLFEMVTNQIIPAVETQLSAFYKTLEGIQSKGLKTQYNSRIASLENTFEALLENTKALEFKLEKLHGLDEEAKMNFIATEIIETMAKVREASDKSELLVADELWPLPKYREMLFSIGLS
jgi:glutamine synthetase